ncbi:MAG: HAMP domain-containing sensor histidine kinase [Sphingobacteriaceae bacterium]|nr:MAG: HAMP domain-containing histidine kinase [Pedobacter sp.]
MNPYKQKRRWKFILFFFALLITGGSLWYTHYLVKNISKAEHTRAEVWAKSTSNIAALSNLDDDYVTFIYGIRDSLAVPAIVADQNDSIIYYRGLDSTKTNIRTEESKKKKYDPAYFKDQLREMKMQHQPIILEGKKRWYVYYKDSLLLTQLRIFPYVQLSVIAIFLIISYSVFSSSRRSEQNLVWVGMAKETAHQLGTPISSLMAWVELLKSKFNAEKEPLVLEMENDIKRLEMVADRFSKIGSEPVLKNHLVYDVVTDFVNYFKVRASDKIKFLVSGDARVEALINIPLFDWVLENLLKNAANAINGYGKIDIRIINNPTKKQVLIDVIDTGKGIPRSKFDTVFQPGYTTRKRGWGLGLSLTKRIVENYHRGHIFVKDSELGKGTTFRVVLKSNHKDEEGVV